MRSSLSRTIRSAVLLALAQIPLAGCGTVADECSSGVACGAGGGATTGTCAPQWITGDATAGGQVLFPCGLPAAPVDDGGESSNSLCATYCMGSQSFNSCSVVIDGGFEGPAFDDLDGGTAPTVVGCYQDHTGRRPAGLVAVSPASPRSIGEALALSAYLEAAAVDAFRDLAEQVAAHGAPATLVDRLRRAALDEVRHARDVGALARAHGAEPPAVTIVATGTRSLLALALENAREGCVRETWGAACAVTQAERAADPELRGAMRRIARDELGHAALSWDLAAWLDARLSAPERALVAETRARAVRELEQEVAVTLPGPWARALGLPSREEARAILASMRVEVWETAEAA